MAVERSKQDDRMSLEEFLKLEKSDPDHLYEYIDGYPYMMTSGSPDHALIENNIGRILGNLLRRRPCLVYGPDVIFQLSGKDRFSPDLSVSCDKRDRNAEKVIQYPCLVVEVLSPGTRGKDKGIKADLYQEWPSIQEILFIDTQVLRVQLYRREGDSWRILSFGPGQTVELTSLGVQFPVVEVYEKTSFDEDFPTDV
ncbi:MAG: Uma2 family endonuclease [Ktedonobacteraceae bacterium]